MEGWKVRLQQEYAITQERYRKVKAYSEKNQNDTPSKYYYAQVPAEQQRITLSEYLNVLELHAKLAHFSLAGQKM